MNPVLETNREAYPHLIDVAVNQEAIQAFVETLLTQELQISELHLFSKEWELSNAFKLSLIFNVMNFCYWAEKNAPKWKITIDEEELDGAIALLRVLEKEAASNPLFLDWNYLSQLSLEDFERLFVGSNTAIPLVSERHANLVTLAQCIIEDYNGDSDSLLESSQNSASRMLEKLTSMLCFEDKSEFNGNLIYFWKRAQLQVKTFNDLNESFGNEPLQDLDILTAFSDYKVPQILRHLGIMEYSEKLSEIVDNYILIDKDSREENEIRIGAIVAVEMIKEEALNRGLNINAAQIDSLLWNRAAANTDPMKPYHRTYTPAY